MITMFTEYLSLSPYKSRLFWNCTKFLSLNTPRCLPNKYLPPIYAVKEKSDEQNRWYYHSHCSDINSNLVAHLYPTKVEKIDFKTFATTRFAHTITNGYLRCIHVHYLIMDRIWRLNIYFMRNQKCRKTQKIYIKY